MTRRRIRRGRRSRNPQRYKHPSLSATRSRPVRDASPFWLVSPTVLLLGLIVGYPIVKGDLPSHS